MLATAKTVTVESFDHLSTKLMHKLQHAKQDDLDFQSISDRSVQEIIREQVESIDTEAPEADEENAFFVADLGEIYRQQQRWKRLLPRIEPFFGMSIHLSFYSFLMHARSSWMMLVIA